MGVRRKESPRRGNDVMNRPSGRRLDCQTLLTRLLKSAASEVIHGLVIEDGGDGSSPRRIARRVIISGFHDGPDWRLDSSKRGAPSLRTDVIRTSASIKNRLDFRGRPKM